MLYESYPFVGPSSGGHLGSENRPQVPGNRFSVKIVDFQDFVKKTLIFTTLEADLDAAPDFLFPNQIPRNVQGTSAKYSSRF